MAIQPQDIADNFSLVDIQAKITSILSAIANAEQSASDSFQDGQANQSVRRQSLSDLYDTLGLWVKAKNILLGTTSSAAELIGADYNPDFLRL